MKPTWRPSRTACSAATAAGFVPGFSTTMYPCEETPSAPATGTTAIAHSARTTMARRFMLSLLLISNPRLTEQLSTDLSSPRGTMPREVRDSNQANHRIDVGETPEPQARVSLMSLLWQQRWWVERESAGRP